MNSRIMNHFCSRFVDWCSKWLTLTHFLSLTSSRGGSSLRQLKKQIPLLVKKHVLIAHLVCLSNPFSGHVNTPQAVIVPSHVSTHLPGDHTWNLAYIAASRINIATANMQTSLCHLHRVLCLPVHLSKASGESLGHLMTGWGMHLEKSLGRII